MPWTFAHPAAILPLRRIGPLRLPMGALVVGSISSDIFYYFGIFSVATFAHTTAGIFMVCLPVGAACLALFYLVRGPVLNLLPQPHRDAIQRATSHDGQHRSRAYLLQAAGLVAGAATHTIWDAFTHVTGYAVQSIAILRIPVARIAGHELYLFHILQHASTVLGVAILIGVYTHWLRRQPTVLATQPGAERIRLTILAGCGVLAVVMAFLISFATGVSGSSLVFRVAIYATSTFGICIIAAALIYRACSDLLSKSG